MTRKSRNTEETRTRLIAAAEAEFNGRGFHATDTNRIARRAGYAPQTFYRHFTDKTAIFVAVYEQWWRAESQSIASAFGRGGRNSVARVAAVMISFHTKWRRFRRSLRHLSVEDDRVRDARAAARRAQIATARLLFPGLRKNDSEIAASLLIFERLCDAAAEGEFVAMGFKGIDARRAVIAALHAFYDEG